MKPKKKDIQKWITALRSGKYKQGQFRLQDDDTYCCLGVSCMEFIPHSQLKLSINCAGEKVMYGHTPMDQPNGPRWLKLIVSDFSIKTDMTLLELNDSRVTFDGKSYPPFTFDEIADVLQAVYIEEVLK